MRVLALNGSPNTNGNISFLIEECFRNLEDKGVECKCINVHNTLKTSKTYACVSCSSPCNGSCYKETALEKAFNEMIAADFIILASPVYFGTVSGILKCFWDKTRNIRSSKSLVGKPMAAISSGHSIFGGQETTIRALQDMALVQGMTIIAEGSKLSDAGHLGIASFDNAEKDDNAIERCRILSERIFDTLCISPKVVQ